jgi:hypothetical protein
MTPVHNPLNSVAATTDERLATLRIRIGLTPVTPSESSVRSAVLHYYWKRVVSRQPTGGAQTQTQLSMPTGHSVLQLRAIQTKGAVKSEMRVY